MSDRLPFQATLAAARYQSMTALPVSVVLENLRSAYNVGSFFRTADAAGVGHLYLCGYTATPPNRGVRKTALGAEDRVRWDSRADILALIDDLRASGSEIAAIETSVYAIDLFDWNPNFPVCVIFGNELEGISPAVAARCDTHIRIPMLGIKHSLNVATAGGVVIYELLRKYRELSASRITRS
jgi:tRNA G18 (ribose-2'-O)-methylase SpoU